MPTFPTYRGELPECLNPLNPRHWFLLLYWIYFRPTAFKCYLYQANPALYRAEPGKSIFRTWRSPAYSNLYVTALIATVLLSVLIGLPYTLFIHWLQETPMDWLSWARGVALGVTAGVALGVTLGVALGMAYSVGGVALGVALGMALGVALGVGYSVAFGVAAGVAAGVAIGMAIGMVGCMAFGMAAGVMFGVALGVAAGVALGVGALRVIFYPFQLGLALCHRLRGVRHPLEWDELVVLPLPCSTHVLTQKLSQDEYTELLETAAIGKNSFQRWALQKAIYHYLHTARNPLHVLYALLTDPNLEEYVVEPTRSKDWEYNISGRRLVFGELAGRFVEASWNTTSEDRLIWWLTLPLRGRRRTPLTHFAGVIYDLLDENIVEAEEFDFPKYTDIYNKLSTYPGGDEIAGSFETIATFLSYDNLPEISESAEVKVTTVFESSIRPTVMKTLNRLRQVGVEIAVYQDSTSKMNQQAALLRATDMLKELNEYVQAEVMAPEQYLLRRIIRQWQALIIEEGGELGRTEIMEPVANPYVIANPVIGDLFVGREDIMQRLEELWVGEGQKPSVVLFGHRRMGKSSILDNLGARFGAQTIIVDFNMQREGMIGSSGELLYNLALAIYDVLPTPDPSQEGNGHPPAPLKGGISLPEPEEEQFTAHNPYTAFNRFLKRLNQERGENRFIITVDEFELVEELIDKGIVEARLLDFWRSLIQTYPWFVMALAGLHTLQEMTEDYWHPLFASVIGIQVSFLRPVAARKLITQPTPDFPIDYDQDAIETIVALTNGQPYLVQLICHGLVTRFNRQRFEEGVERELRFSLEDVEAVINAPEFFRDGNAYFTGVWVQAEKSEPAGQTQVLRTLAESETGKSAEEIARGAGLTLEEVHAALETLVRHDVVKKANEHWQFTVELMRRWVAKKKE